jgi:hypothetical protein
MGQEGQRGGKWGEGFESHGGDFLGGFEKCAIFGGFEKYAIF